MRALNPVIGRGKCADGAPKGIAEQTEPEDEQEDGSTRLIVHFVQGSVTIGWRWRRALEGNVGGQKREDEVDDGASRQARAGQSLKPVAPLD